MGPHLSTPSNCSWLSYPKEPSKRSPLLGYYCLFCRGLSEWGGGGGGISHRQRGGFCQSYLSVGNLRRMGWQRWNKPGSCGRWNNRMDVERDESLLKASRVRCRTSGPPRTGDWIPFGTHGDPGMFYSCTVNRTVANPAIAHKQNQAQIWLHVCMQIHHSRVLRHSELNWECLLKHNSIPEFELRYQTGRINTILTTVSKYTIVHTCSIVY